MCRVTKVIPAVVLTSVAALFQISQVKTNTLVGLPRKCDPGQMEVNPRDPQTFFWCLSGGPVLMRCSGDLVFDANQEKCVDVADMEEVINDDYSLDPIKDIDDLPDCPRVDPMDTSVYFPGPDCSQFYECSNGLPVLLECNDGLHFNPNLDVCDWPEDAGCRDKPTPRPKYTRTILHRDPNFGY